MYCDPADHLSVGSERIDAIVMRIVVVVDFNAIADVECWGWVGHGVSLSGLPDFCKVWFVILITLYC